MYVRKLRVEIQIELVTNWIIIIGYFNKKIKKICKKIHRSNQIYKYKNKGSIYRSSQKTSEILCLNGHKID